MGGMVKPVSPWVVKKVGYGVGGQRGLGRVRGGELGGGGAGVLTGRVAGDRGAVAEQTRAVNVVCAQEEHRGTDPKVYPNLLDTWYFGAYRWRACSKRFQTLYGACPKNETCAFSGRLTHHCTVAGGVGYEKILDWPPWKEPLPRRSWLTTA